MFCTVITTVYGSCELSRNDRGHKTAGKKWRWSQWYEVQPGAWEALGSKLWAIRSRFSTATWSRLNFSQRSGPKKFRWMGEWNHVQQSKSYLAIVHNVYRQHSQKVVHYFSLKLGQFSILLSGCPACLRTKKEGEDWCLGCTGLSSQDESVWSFSCSIEIKGAGRNCRRMRRERRRKSWHGWEYWGQGLVPGKGWNLLNSLPLALPRWHLHLTPSLWLLPPPLTGKAWHSSEEMWNSWGWWSRKDSHL